MIEATSCGGVVIFRGKILVLYKNYKSNYEGWVLPKGTVEPGEEHWQTALREVREETGVEISYSHLILSDLLCHAKRLHTLSDTVNSVDSPQIIPFQIQVFIVRSLEYLLFI